MVITIMIEMLKVSESICPMSQRSPLSTGWSFDGILAMKLAKNENHKNTWYML